MKNGTLSKKEASKLFEENAVLFGRRDGVPEDIAVSLFGSAAVAFAERQKDAAGLVFNGYGIGDYTAMYLTEYGFHIAATYCNVERIKNRLQHN